MRANGWDVALIDWAASNVGRPFVWGQTDCTLLVAEAIDIITGRHDQARQYRGAWRDLASAVAWSKAHARDLLDGCLLAECAVVPSIAFAQRGDIVLVPYAEIDGVNVYGGHVLLGDCAISSTPEAGVHYVSLGGVRIEGCRLLRVGG